MRHVTIKYREGLEFKETSITAQDDETNEEIIERAREALRIRHRHYTGEEAADLYFNDLEIVSDEKK
jgi:hypothetical protein